MIKSNPFTPQTVQEPKTFSGRSEHIELFNKKTEKAISGKSDHMLT